MKTLLETLVELENNNLIHRDISPANIILKTLESEEEDIGSPILIDFGLAV